MAKAKKSSSDETAEKKPAAKEPKTAATAEKKPAAGKKGAAKKAPAPAAQPVGVPLVDTSLAAQNAARMLLNRPAEGAATAGGAGKESAAFKSMKEQLAKPKPTGLSGLFGAGGGEKKSSSHNILNQQKGHNQTFGGMNKAGVPRRTNG
jgi:hypothetical protein